MRVARLWAGVAGFMALAISSCAPTPGQGAPPGRSEPSGRRFVNPGTLAALDGFTHAVRLGFVTYVSGEVALDSTGALVGPGDLAAQARQAFANLALERLNRAKDKMLNHLSHELKTPLAIIEASLFIMERRLKSAGVSSDAMPFERHMLWERLSPKPSGFICVH